MGNALQRPRSANEPLGVLLAPFLVTSAVTGLAIWLQLALGTGTAVTLIAVHAYIGLVGLPVLVLKTAAGLTAWRRRGRRRSGGNAPVEHLMTALLVVVVVALYGSGVALFANTTIGGAGLYKTLHLWSAVLGVPVVSHHLWRFLTRARTVVTRAVSAAPEPALSTGRRHLLVAGALALLAWGAVRLGAQVPAAVAGSEPNDFPLTLTSGGADQPDPRSWRMRVDGDVERALTVGLADLRSGPVERHRYSLDCVLGWSVTRTWGGVPLSYLLDQARPVGELISVVVASTTGYRVALPAATARDPRTLIAWEVDGVDLTPEHGFPARVMAPDVIGELCVKWVDSVTVVRA